MAMSDAERKFWLTPELVEMLLLYLNSDSAAGLATLYPLVAQLYQRESVWKNLVRKSICVYQDLQPETFEQLRGRVQDLVKILEEMDCPKPLLLELLDAICKITPSAEGSAELKIKLKCPRHISHSVSVRGFLLLEQVEQNFGTAELQVEEIRSDSLGMPPLGELVDPLFSALSSRASRQRIDRLFTVLFFCFTRDQAETFHALLQNCQSVHVSKLIIYAGVGQEGWSAIAKGVRLHPLGFTLRTRRDAMLESTREDLRTIWDAQADGDFGEWVVLAPPGIRVSRYPGYKVDLRLAPGREQDWAKLQQLLDETQQQETGEDKGPGTKDKGPAAME